MTAPQWMEIGRVVGAHGLRGEVRVYPNSDFPERFLEPGQRWLQRTPQSELEAVELIKGRFLAGKGIYVVQFKQVCDRNTAETLRGAVLFVPASDRPPLAADEFYVADLIGLDVFIQGDSEPIGVVVDLYSAGNDLLAVAVHGQAEAAATSQKRQPKQPLPVLVPFVPEIVPVVDLEAGYVEVTPPAGLFDR